MELSRQQDEVTESQEAEANNGADTTVLIVATAGSSVLTICLFFACWKLCAARRLKSEIAEESAEEDLDLEKHKPEQDEEHSRQSKDQLLFNTSGDLKQLKEAPAESQDDVSLLEK